MRFVCEWIFVETAETESHAEIDSEWDRAWAAQMNEEKEKQTKTQS